MSVGSRPGQYRFGTRWVVRAPVADVWATIVAVARWPAWWRGVESATVLGVGGSDGVGTRVGCVFRSVLPYRLTFEMTLAEVEPRRRLVADATGDLVGVGCWSLAADGDATTLDCVWHVQPTGAALRVLGPVLAPVLVWNHHVVMRWGAQGLARELHASLLGVHGRPTVLASAARSWGPALALSMLVRAWRRRR